MFYFKKVDFFKNTQGRREVLKLCKKSEYTKHFSSIYYKKLDCIVAYHDKKSIGFVLYNNMKKQEVTRIRGIFIDDDYRGRGLFSKIIYVIPDLKRTIMVCMREENVKSEGAFHKIADLELVEQKKVKDYWVNHYMGELKKCQKSEAK